jgi:hypothetical protein
MYSTVKNWRPHNASRGKSSKYMLDSETMDEQNGVAGGMQNTKIINTDGCLVNDSDDEDFKKNKLTMCHKGDENTNNINIKECMIQLAQNILVPMFFSLLAITLSYSSISAFSCFDSIRIYSLFVCKLHSFFNYSYLKKPQVLYESI